MPKQTRLIMGMPVCVSIADAAAREADLEPAFDCFAQADARFSPFKPESELSRLNRGEITPAECSSQMHEILALAEQTRIDSDGYFDIRRPDGTLDPCGMNEGGEDWRVGIRSPFQAEEIVKVLVPRGAGVATSGTYLRGAHIYNPHAQAAAPAGIASLTVIGPDILEADRFATAAFAMGETGIDFIERVHGLEGYQIDARGLACMTSGLERYLS